jgi:hypothetical protein
LELKITQKAEFDPMSLTQILLTGAAPPPLLHEIWKISSPTSTGKNLNFHLVKTMMFNIYQLWYFPGKY